MSTQETDLTAAAPLVALGDADAQPAETFLQALRTAYADETAPPRTGAARS